MHEGLHTDDCPTPPVAAAAPVVDVGCGNTAAAVVEECRGPGSAAAAAVVAVEEGRGHGSAAAGGMQVVGVGVACVSHAHQQAHQEGPLVGVGLVVGVG